MCCQGYYPPLPLSAPVSFSVTTATTDMTATMAAETPRASAGAGADESGLGMSPSWLTDEKIHESDTDSDNTSEDDEDGNNQSRKKLKTSTSTAPTHGPLRASSLTSNAVYAFDASQAHSTLNPPTLHTIDSKDSGTQVSALHTTESAGREDSAELASDRKRQRQILIQRHSVVFSKTNSGPTASYMGVCRLPYDPESQGTRQQRRHRRIDMKSYPRSYLPFAMLYFTGVVCAVAIWKALSISSYTVRLSVW